MSPLATELITPEEAAKLGAHAPSASVMLTLSKTFSVPANIHASNVRSMRRDGSTNLFCQGVVSSIPLVYGEEMVFVESAALLLGFYNNGFDEAGAPILVAAYGKPVFLRGHNVTIGPDTSATVCCSVFHYEDMILYVTCDVDPKTP